MQLCNSHICSPITGKTCSRPRSIMARETSPSCRTSWRNIYQPRLWRRRLKTSCKTDKYSVFCVLSDSLTGVIAFPIFVILSTLSCDVIKPSTERFIPLQWNHNNNKQNRNTSLSIQFTRLLWFYDGVLQLYKLARLGGIHTRLVLTFQIHDGFRLDDLFRQ